SHSSCAPLKFSNSVFQFRGFSCPRRPQHRAKFTTICSSSPGEDTSVAWYRLRGSGRLLIVKPFMQMGTIFGALLLNNAPPISRVVQNPLTDLADASKTTADDLDSASEISRSQSCP